MLLDKQAYGATPPSGFSFVERLAHREPDREGFYDRDSFVAYVLTLAASWAYADVDTVADAMGRLGLPHCRQVTMANDAMLVQANAFFLQSEDGRQGILCFRGTEPRNVIAWLGDASVHVEPVPGMGRVHGGFYRNVIFIWHRIEAAIDEALAGSPARNGGQSEGRLRPLEDLYICGHSLGAAMAVVAAAKIFDSDRYREWKKRVRGIYTYGQPIVGDAEFAAICDKRFGKMLFRHVYNHDLVPHLPPSSTGRFVHFGREYRGSDYGWQPIATPSLQARSIAVSTSIALLAWLFRQLHAFAGLRLPFSIDDHSPNNYLHASRTEIGSEWFGDLAIGGEPAPRRYKEAAGPRPSAAMPPH
jgi:hypothetical protein